jgi:hypothetical protein
VSLEPQAVLEAQRRLAHRGRPSLVFVPPAASATVPRISRSRRPKKKYLRRRVDG